MSRGPDIVFGTHPFPAALDSRVNGGSNERESLGFYGVLCSVAEYGSGDAVRPGIHGDREWSATRNVDSRLTKSRHFSGFLKNRTRIS